MAVAAVRAMTSLRICEGSRPLRVSGCGIAVRAVRSISGRRLGFAPARLDMGPGPPHQKTDDIAADRGAQSDGEDAERDWPGRMVQPEQHSGELARCLLRGGGI